jgi:cytochrome P450
LQRTVSFDGLGVLGDYVSAVTMVSVPTYTVHRDARYFPRPDQFLPERWLDENKNDRMLNKNALYLSASALSVSVYDFFSS